MARDPGLDQHPATPITRSRPGEPPGPAGPATAPRPRNAGPGGAGRTPGTPPRRPDRPTRWRAASVPTTSRAAAGTSGAELPVTSTASTPVRAESSSVARVTPTRSDLRRDESHSAHTAGRTSPHRRHCSTPPAAGWAMAPPHRVHRTSDPHCAQASRRMRPVRLRMHTTRPSGRSSTGCNNRARRSENSPVRGSSPVRSTTSTMGQPRRSRDRVGGHHRGPFGQRQRRARRDQHAPGRRGAGPARSRRPPPTRSAPAPPGRPRRGRRAPPPLRSRSIGAQAPARDPTTDTRARRGLLPLVGQQGRRDPGAGPAGSASWAARARDGASTSRPRPPIRWMSSLHHQGGVERRGQPHDDGAPASRTLVHDGHRAATRARGGTHRGRPGGTDPSRPGAGPPEEATPCRGTTTSGRPIATPPTRPPPPPPVGGPHRSNRPGA